MSSDWYARAHAAETAVISAVQDNKDFNPMSVLLLARKCNVLGDQEIRHECLDQLLYGFLKSLGHDDIAEEYMKRPKWYA